jgi:hypothetical protein
MISAVIFTKVIFPSNINSKIELLNKVLCLMQSKHRLWTLILVSLQRNEIIVYI